MIISGDPRRRVPEFYRKRVLRSIRDTILDNPGFHRLVVTVRPCLPVDYEVLVNPDIEPRLRSLFGRIMRLDQAVIDDDPYQLI